MAHVLTNIGEEYILKHNLEGVKYEVGLYHDVNNTTPIGDGSNYADIDTEPSTGNYVAQWGYFTLEMNANNNWYAVNDAPIDFNVTDTIEKVDSYFIRVFDFMSITANGVTGDHLIVTGGLAQERDLSHIDTFELDAKSVGFSVD